MKYALYALVILLAAAAGFALCWYWKVRPVEQARIRMEEETARLEAEIDARVEETEEEVREKIRGMDPADVIALYLEPETVERIYRDIPERTDRILAVLAEFMARFAGGGGADPPGGEGGGGGRGGGGAPAPD